MIAPWTDGLLNRQVYHKSVCCSTIVLIGCQGANMHFIRMGEVQTGLKWLTVAMPSLETSERQKRDYIQRDKRARERKRDHERAREEIWSYLDILISY